jgi:transcription-repair coupling factor (superfamily II helicase)
MYKGTEFIVLDQGRRRQEYLAIEYADEARILLPVDQVNLLSKFNVNQDIKPKLSKLGGSDWERTKKKVKKSVQRIAQDLINLYALREKQKGYIYPPDTPWQIEVEDAFPYNETEDQLKAIDAIKSDLESDKLMDRLICGDAGYGKTEVILRAVFKVIMEGKQVAILVPTTVLAQQHYNVFSDRYAPYPIRIGLLSRFKTAKEQREVVTKAKLGEVDLVIGTHRLLQKDVQFKNLGLLIIDEEQRFGVSHKERLKEFRKDLDVISMSATPIPRTLHMSLSGIRDISLISTPPTNRKPVKTFVGEYKNSLVRNAILHELERGGKVFFVHNRVENIESIAYIVQELVPEAHVRIAHGQMKDRELEDVMFAFVNNEFDVIVCTTIVETGLDIADANTIIINDANKFGLSQLYQLRGRVGRSDVQAYAYLLYKPDGEMSDTARERLKAIRELTKLGSGYQIAMRDMEIRGVGNVFGAEQHGHMLSVGFDLYCKILSDTIEEMKGNLEADTLEKNTVVDIKINAYFPENWISDKKQRMNEYKRLSICKDQNSLDNLVNEWQDRFGLIPSEAKNLIEICRLKILANQYGVSSITQEGDLIRITTSLRLQTWLPVQRKLSPFLQSRLSFKSGAVGALNSSGIISFKISGIDADNMIDTLKEIIIASNLKT